MMTRRAEECNNYQNHGHDAVRFKDYSTCHDPLCKFDLHHEYHRYCEFCHHCHNKILIYCNICNKCYHLDNPHCSLNCTIHYTFDNIVSGCDLNLKISILSHPYHDKSWKRICDKCVVCMPSLPIGHFNPIHCDSLGCEDDPHHMTKKRRFKKCVLCNQCHEIELKDYLIEHFPIPIIQVIMEYKDKILQKQLKYCTNCKRCEKNPHCLDPECSQDPHHLFDN